MPQRDLLRYVAAFVVAAVMIASGNEPWPIVGIVVLILAVLALAWHSSIVSGRGTPP